ncbi:MAG TPA: nuclear transport factor 2 family protein [Saprospiraceae bacterium]|nr:nuclear transport factor 2 family protein [Saprospiraceae bacterium]HMU03861.1 nuclear transport factor 2 family protein [Saprospiraceae bacterium]
MAFQLHFVSAHQLIFVQILPNNQFGRSEKVKIQMVEIKPNVYMVYWKEKSGTIVAHLEDFQNEIVYTNITSPDQIFVNLKGILTKINTNNMDNKQKVVDLLKSLETGAAEPVGYINPNKYIQHNLGVGDGLAGFGAVLQALPPNSAKANTVRVFQDGDYVFAHTEYDFFGPKAGFDVFRFEDGKIVEHWDNLTEITPPNPSDRTQFDGETKVSDIDKTEENKNIVTGFVNDVLKDGKVEKLTTYINPNKYLQHNSGVADGLDGLGAALDYFAQNGLVMIYDKVHKILGEGNFVLTVSEGKFGKGDNVAFYDLFRVENGQIVEHWDIIEPIPAQEYWKNNNGKF